MSCSFPCKLIKEVPPSELECSTSREVLLHLPCHFEDERLLLHRRWRIISINTSWWCGWKCWFHFALRILGRILPYCLFYDKRRSVVKLCRTDWEEPNRSGYEQSFVPILFLTLKHTLHHLPYEVYRQCLLPSVGVVRQWTWNRIVLHHCTDVMGFLKELL